jgi:hypothetical protein
MNASFLFGTSVNLRHDLFQENNVFFSLSEGCSNFGTQKHISSKNGQNFKALYKLVLESFSSFNRAPKLFTFKI